MKSAAILLTLARLTLAEEPPSEAYISQSLFQLDGTIITAETPLNQREGSASSLPLHGFMAKFDLFVYPLAFGDELEEDTLPEAIHVDEEVVGILPKVSLTFHGKDDFEHPRTPASEPFKIKALLIDPPNPSSEENNMSWIRHFILRKRYLNAEHIGASDQENHWQEGPAIPITHERSNQLHIFDDIANPPHLDQASYSEWSGIQQYVFSLSEEPGTPFPGLPLKTLSVRVWPDTTATIQNIEDGRTYSAQPSNVRVEYSKVYPGYKKLIVTLCRKDFAEEEFSQENEAILYEENWTAVTSQERFVPVDLSEFPERGDYKLKGSIIDSRGVSQTITEVDWKTNGGLVEIRASINSAE